MEGTGRYIVRLAMQIVGLSRPLEDARAFTSKRPDLRYTIYEDGNLIEMTGHPPLPKFLEHHGPAFTPPSRIFAGRGLTETRSVEAIGRNGEGRRSRQNIRCSD
jgi:hypothetical protein